MFLDFFQKRGCLLPNYGSIMKLTNGASDFTSYLLPEKIAPFMQTLVGCSAY